MNWSLTAFAVDRGEPDEYTRALERIVADCEREGLSIQPRTIAVSEIVDRFHGQDTGRACCRYKPTLIRQALTDFEYVTYIDADTRILAPIQLAKFRKPLGMVANPFLEKWIPDHHYAFGAHVLTFRRSPETADLLDRWDALCHAETNPAIGDHVHLLSLNPDFEDLSPVFAGRLLLNPDRHCVMQPRWPVPPCKSNS